MARPASPRRPARRASLVAPHAPVAGLGPRLRVALSLALLAVACESAPAPRASEEPKSAADWLAEGEEALALGEWDDASAAFREAGLLGVARSKTLPGLARAEFGRGRPDAAISAFRGLLRDAPEIFDPRADAYDATVERDYCKALDVALAQWLSKGELDWAIGALDERASRTRKRCPRWGAEVPTAAMRTCLAASARAARSGDREAELEWIERAGLEAPESPLPDRRHARLLLDLGRRRHAIDHLERALGRHRDDRELQSLMVEALGGSTSAP